MTGSAHWLVVLANRVYYVSALNVTRSLREKRSVLPGEFVGAS